MAESGMARARLHLDLPEVAAAIDKLHAAERGGWRKTRLLAVRLAARRDTHLRGGGGHAQ